MLPAPEQPAQEAVPATPLPILVVIALPPPAPLIEAALGIDQPLEFTAVQEDSPAPPWTVPG